MKTVDLTKENIPFLVNTPLGTKMYLVIHNRERTEMWVKEAVYQGFSKHYQDESYYEYNMSNPVTIKDTFYHVKFTVDGKPITIICSSPSYWVGQRGYDTNEHLEYAADFKTKMEVNISGCIDAYFTTDVDMFKKYIETDNVLSDVERNINEKIRQYQEMIQGLEKSIMDIMSVPKEYFEDKSYNLISNN